MSARNLTALGFSVGIGVITGVYIFKPTLQEQSEFWRNPGHQTVKAKVKRNKKRENPMLRARQRPPMCWRVSTSTRLNASTCSSFPADPFSCALTKFAWAWAIPEVEQVVESWGRPLYLIASRGKVSPAEVDRGLPSTISWLDDGPDVRKTAFYC
ncbi:hypothetical protein LA080_009457 [Diaporthe eres]|nr:hypothetical protein LA080_009457 [Diaporthe eres]